MVKSKKNQFNTVTPLSKALAMICFVAFPILAFYLGGQFEKIKQQTDQPLKINNQTKKLSQPAKLVEGFYTQYVNCLDKNLENCDSFITTKYFTQDFINTMSNNVNPFCGYEPSKRIYVTESEQGNDDTVLNSQSNQMAEVILWVDYVTDKPIVVSLKQGVIDGIVHQPWQIYKITCS